MSATLLMMNHTTKMMNTKTKEKKDMGICFNCVYQGTGSEKCHVCKRASQWHYYKAPKNLSDNFKIRY